jgi:hypothetical protein
VRTFGKIFVVSTLFAGAAYAGSEAEPQESLDSVGDMFLEASRDIPVEPVSHSDQMSACQSQQEEITAKMASLKEFLALSDDKLAEMTLKRAPNKQKSYEIALASLEIELRRAKEAQPALRDAVAQYRKAIRINNSSVSADIDGDVLADVEAALAAAEAALSGATN